MNKSVKCAQVAQVGGMSSSPKWYCNIWGKDRDKEPLHEEHTQMLAQDMS